MASPMDSLRRTESSTRLNSSKSSTGPLKGIPTAGNERRSPLGDAFRRMPESLEAEAAVLGSMILDPVCIAQIVQLLNAQAFYRVEHQLIFDALVGLYEKNSEKGIDLVLLRNELKKHKQLEDVGGVDYLVKLAESVPSSANVIYYSHIVKDKALMRELIQASSEILTNAYSDTGDINQALDEAERKIFAVSDQKITGEPEPLKSLLTEALERFETKGITGLSTGFAQLDELTCGLQKNEMIIVAGRPSMGKTSFALNIAEYIGVDNDVPVAVFSLEMSKQQLAERILCCRSEVDAQRARKGMLNAEEMQKLVESGSELFEKPIYIDDTAGLSPLELRGKARRLKSQYNIQCIIVDYLQLMSFSSGRQESRQQEISAISRYLKSLARELSVPVVALSQLNRSPEGREGHRPRMSDLRESGALEQDADVVMLLHREDYYHRGDADYTPDNTAEIIIAKQRNGPTGLVKLTFFEQFMRFATSHKEVPF